MRIELQSIGLDRFVTSSANTVGRVRGTAEGLIDLPHFFLVPPGQAVKQAEPVLIGKAIHPLGILFNLMSFPLKVLKSCFYALTPLPKPIGTGDDL